MTSPFVTPFGMPNQPPGPSMPPNGYGTPPRGRAATRNVLVAVALVLAIVLATAALVVSIIAMRRPPMVAPTPQPAPVDSPTASSPLDTAAADRSLCEAVGPLLHESNETGKTFVNLGNPGTPARDAGIADYEASVLDWVKRIQPIVDSHPNADGFLRRTLQRMIDDIRVYATSIRPGPETAPDAAAWNDATIGYSGPFDVCHRLGVTW